MKIWVIGHSEAIQGFALVGVSGMIAETVDTTHEALDFALANKELGLVLVTEDCSHLVPERIKQLKTRVEPPVFLEIPSPKNIDSNKMSLNEIAEQAIGIRH